MSINKEQIYLKCLDLVNEQIEKYQSKMDGISGANSEKKFNPDFDVYGNKGEMLNKYEQYAGYLDRSREMKETLANLEKDYASEVVRPGSVVETKNNYYYIAVALGEIEMDSGSEVFAISKDAPIYKYMEGKKAGDNFEFNGDTIEIVKIY